MEEENTSVDEEQQLNHWPEMSPEIVEIGDDSKNAGSSRDGGPGDVYVAVGKYDLDVLKWALDHALSPGSRVFLVHVFPPITYIPTPVGKMSRSRLSQEQVRIYLNEENNRRRNLMLKYIKLCAEAKVTVDTMLLESNATAKAILDLIPVLNITSLVMGTKRPLSSRRSMKGMGKGEFVWKNAPEFCNVALVYDGKRAVDGQHFIKPVSSAISSGPRRPQINQQSERSFFHCLCFSGRC